MSDELKEYKIQYAGLKKGIHEFTYELNESFFANFENALIQKCQVEVSLSFDNRQLPYVMDIDMDGEIWNDCDRCTASIPVTIHNSYTVFVKQSVEKVLNDDDEEEIIYISKEDTEIDISHFLYEFVHLSVPVHVICDNPGKTEYCDTDILRFLEKAPTDDTITDPRWAELDKLKDKLN